jgi:CRISPR/Cas system-associated protein Cas5 (RAMP superfamily)
MRTFAPVIVRGEEAQGVRFWGFGKTVYQELLSVIADPDYGDITDAVNGRDVSVEFITAEESGASFPKTSIRVKPNQTPVVEDKAQLENLLENQKDITELYQELSYEELTDVLNQWLNPEASDDEEKKETAPASVVAAESKATVEDASAAFDELFNK